MKLARIAVVLAALAVLLYAAGVALGLPPQAPVPPQAPQREFSCECGVAGCHRYADGECHCGPRLRPGGRGVDCPLYEAKTPRPDGRGYCSPACSCGCNGGAPCDCGAVAARSRDLAEVREILAARLAEKRRDAYQPAPVYYAPAGGCAGGSCGAAPARGLFRRR
jgi:hypothetical protein